MARFRRYRAVIQIVFGAVAVAFLVYLVVSERHELMSALYGVNAGWLACSLVAAYLGTVFGMLCWRSVVRAFGTDLSVAIAGEVNFTAQIGKYIPGGIWPIVAGAQIGVRAGLPAAVTAVSMTLQLVISVITSGVVSIGTLLLVPELAERFWWVIAIVLGAGATALLPRVTRRLLAWAFRLMRRGEQLPVLDASHLGRAVLWSLANWLAFGVHLWALFAAVARPEPALFVPALSGYALSWVIGFLAVFAPAGAGVREGILVALFAGSVGTATVLGVALVSRVGFVVVDASLFAAAALVRVVPRAPRSAP
jgi:uncharacterized membrane protein YbhN (UPF0104 family)